MEAPEEEWVNPEEEWNNSEQGGKREPRFLVLTKHWVKHCESENFWPRLPP